MHIYELLDGVVEPRHFVTDKNGNLRSSTLRDFRTMHKDGRIVRPSVSTIISSLDKPQLLNWKIDQHLQTAYEFDMDAGIEGFTLQKDEYLSRIKSMTKDRMDIAPTAGTNFHSLLNDRINNVKSGTHAESEIIDNVFDTLESNTGYSAISWIGETNFITDRYAGQIDCHNNHYLIDFKTKNSGGFKRGKMVYDDHVIQLAAYRAGISSTANCANLFIDLQTGETDLHFHKESELDRGLKIFNACTDIWYLKNNVSI
jgi:hypothetical protein